MATNNQPPAPLVPVHSFPTPLGRADVLFYELRDGRLVPNQSWIYGEAHPSEQFKLTHKLVYVAPYTDRDGGSGWQRWFYAAERLSQETYNAQISYPWPDNDYPVVTRFSVALRSTFAPLAVGAVDPAFPTLILTGQKMVDVGTEELRSIFVGHEATFERLPGYVSSSVSNVSNAEQVTYTQRVSSLNPGLPPVAPGEGTWTRLKAEVTPTNDPTVSQWTVTYQRLHKVNTFITPVKDIVFYELHDSKADTSPDYGTAHPDMDFTSYQLAHVSPVDDTGMQRWYYAVTLEDQHRYNYEYDRGTAGNQWPVLKQIFFVPRSTAVGTVYTRPTVTGVDFTPFTKVSEHIARTDDKVLDGLFHVVELEYEWHTDLIGYEIDTETGHVFPVITEKVPAGAVGASVDSDGFGSEVTPINVDFSIRTTRKFVGMATETRSYESIDNFSWPPVLLGIDLDVITDPTQTEIVRVLVNNVWKTRGYNGPCRMLVTEDWGLAAPTVEIPPQMILTPIEYNGLFFDLRVEPCLHPAIYYQETTGTESSRYAYFGKTRIWSATNFLDWPESMIVRSSPQPFRGGYLTKKFEVFSPSGDRAA